MPPLPLTCVPHFPLNLRHKIPPHPPVPNSGQSYTWVERSPGFCSKQTSGPVGHQIPSCPVLLRSSATPNTVSPWFHRCAGSLVLWNTRLPSLTILFISIFFMLTEHTCHLFVEDFIQWGNSCAQILCCKNEIEPFPLTPFPYKPYFCPVHSSLNTHHWLFLCPMVKRNLVSMLGGGSDKKICCWSEFRKVQQPRMESLSFCGICLHQKTHQMAPTLYFLIFLEGLSSLPIVCQGIVSKSLLQPVTRQWWSGWKGGGGHNLSSSMSSQRSIPAACAHGVLIGAGLLDGRHEAK